MDWEPEVFPLAVHALALKQVKPKVVPVRPRKIDWQAAQSVQGLVNPLSVRPTIQE
jgi:hypothetical protein